MLDNLVNLLVRNFKPYIFITSEVSFPYNLHSPPNINWTIKWIRIRLERHVLWVREVKMHIFLESMRGRSNSENHGVNDIKTEFGETEMGVWIGFIWLTICSGDGLL
jgi:hypothetical protein